jgi:hypothetical protein
MGGRMPSAWELDRSEEPWSDREAWRGDVYAEDADYWRAEACDEEEESEWADQAEQDEDPLDADADWPEDLAGPEYWMFKRDCDQ